MDTNVIIISGNLAVAPVTKDTATTMELASVGLDGKSTYVMVVASGKLGILCAKYLGKGNRVLVQGRLGSKDGTHRIVADSVQFLNQRSHGIEGGVADVGAKTI